MVVVTSAHANHSSLVPVSIQPAEAHDVDMNTNFITTLASSCFLLPSADILFHLLSLPPPKTPKGNYTFGLALANTTNSRHMPPKPNPKPNAAGGGVVPTIDKDGRPLPSRDVMRARFAQTVGEAMGWNGVNRANGAHQGNGVNGENGGNGANGVNGANRTHQVNATNGANMANGANRTNGANPTHQPTPSTQPNQTNPPPNPQEPKLFLRIRGLSDDKNKKNDNKEKEKETNKNDTRRQETQSASASASLGTVAPGGEAPSSPSTSSSSSSSSSDSQATISAHSSSSSSESASPPQITNVNINNNVWNAAGYSTQNAREEDQAPQVQDYGVHLLSQAARYIEGAWDGDEDERRAAGILVAMRHDY
jgi:hypothetical protein